MVKRQEELAVKLQKALKQRKPKTWTKRPEVLLCPNVPKPMHGVAPRVVLGEKWWNETRQKAYRSTSFHCVACGVHKLRARARLWLEAHELYAINYERGQMVYIEAVPLCHFCHNYIHDGRLRALLEQRKITHAKFAAIIRHGDDVLSAAGLTRVSYENREKAIIDKLLNGKVADWKDWRLVIDGKEYKPKFKTPKQWERAMR